MAEQHGGKYTMGKWTKHESQKLNDAIELLGEKNWTQVSKYLAATHNIRRLPTQCRHRWHKTMIPNLKKGQWDNNESQLLRQLVTQQKDNSMEGATIDWEAISKFIEGRTGKACRERWTSRVDPSINRLPFTQEEETQLLVLHAQLQNQWAKIAEQMPGRTADAVKSKYISIKRRVSRGLEDPAAISIQVAMNGFHAGKRKELDASDNFSGSPPKRRLPLAIGVPTCQGYPAELQV